MSDLGRNELVNVIVRVSLVSLATYFSVKWYEIDLNIAANYSLSNYSFFLGC
jgi:hypothetical protein